MGTGLTSLSALARVSRWDPEFFGDGYKKLSSALDACGAVPLRSFVARANRGVSPSYDPSGTVRVVNSINVRDLEFSESRQSYVSSSFLSCNPEARVGKGDIVVTSTGIGTLGRSFCHLGDDEYLADGHVTILRLVNPNLAPYICAFLQSPLGRSQFIQRRRGSSRQVELYPEDILSVLVPPLEVIGNDAPSEWLSAVAEVRSSAESYPKAEAKLLSNMGWPLRLNDTRNYFRTTIGEATLHGRIDPEFYAPDVSLLADSLRLSDAIPFGDVVKRYVKGVQPESYDSAGATLVIKSKDVSKGGISWSGCDSADLTEPGGEVAPGMLVMNMTGVGTLGRAAVVPPLPHKTVISVDVSGWELHEDQLPAEYVSLFLNSPPGMLQTQRYQTGSSGQLHLYPEHVKRLLIPVRRSASGTLDKTWHADLAEKVRSATKTRSSAYSRLAKIHARIAAAVGVDPKIARE